MRKFLISGFLLAVLAIGIILSSCNQGGNVSKSNVPSTEKNSPDTMNSTTTASQTTEPVKMNIYEVKDPQYIDDATINIIKDAMNQGQDFSYFEQFETGTTLKIEDLKKYKFSESEKEFLDSLGSVDEQEHYTHICLIDIDNDGSDEITISQYRGGTMGILYFAVLKKDNNDKYSKAVDFDYENGITFSLNNTLSFIRLSNKNYLLVKDTDYSDKTFSGISLYSFIGGKYAESAKVDLYAKKTNTTEKGADYSQYNEYLDFMNIEDVIKITEQGKVKSGTAEKLTASSDYEVDINNDGKNEVLEKRYRETTTYYFPSQLVLEINSTDLKKIDSDPLKVITGTSFNQKNMQQFWCDYFHQKNLINVFYRDDSSPVYRLDIYLLEGVKSVKVGWIKVTPNRNIGIKYFKH